MRSAVVPRAAIATNGAPSRSSIRPKNSPAQNGIRTLPRSFASNAKCSLASGEALQAIAELDLDALAAIDPPRGYGRDCFKGDAKKNRLTRKAPYKAQRAPN